MRRDFGFHPDARAKVRAAVRHYEAEAAGLGAEFAEDIRVAVDRARENPSIGAPGDADSV